MDRELLSTPGRAGVSYVAGGFLIEWPHVEFIG